MSASRNTASKRLSSLIPVLWLVPSIVLIAVIIVYPIYELFVMSFSEISMSGIRKGYNGLDNYRELFADKTFIAVINNTFVWTIAVVGISTALSLAIANILNQKFPGRRLVRSALIIPWSVSLIITSVIWKWILDYNYGALNLLLKKLGVINEDIYWLAKASSSFPAMIWVAIMVTIPFTSFILLAGLQSISKDLYEAADVDGASGWKRFMHITLPLLKSPLTVSVVLNTIYVFNSFPIVWSITKGDPVNKTDLVTTYLYKLAFQSYKMGQAAAVSVISFVILLIFAIVYVSLSLRKEEERA